MNSVYHQPFEEGDVGEQKTVLVLTGVKSMGFTASPNLDCISHSVTYCLSDLAIVKRENRHLCVPVDRSEFDRDEINKDN